MVSKAKPKKKTQRRRVMFRVEAPQAKEVALVGDHNKWNVKAHPMKRTEEGVWEKIVMLAPGRYEYKFFVDGKWWTDSKNEQACVNCFGTQNSVITIS